MPKAVLWRQHDIYMNAMGGRTYGTGEPVTGLDEIVERSQARRAGLDDGRPAHARRGAMGRFINLAAEDHS